MTFQQLELFKDDNKMADEKKPRLTLKAKKAAVNDMMEQVKNGWEPCDEVWRLLDWLNYDIREAVAKKGGG